MTVSTPYELEGRSDQKRRTRDALIAAARELVARGESPTVEAAAEAASISRTTAYRYFPSQHALLSAAHPETGATSMLADDAPADDVAARLDLVIDRTTRLVVDTEAQQRTMLRLSLEADPAERAQLPLRQGRVIKWIEEALAPLRPQMAEAELHRVAIAIRSATGIEALVWLTDVAGLSRRDARELMGWSARAMLKAAMADNGTRGVSAAGPPARPRRPRARAARSRMR
jgi:AcrR family transcriptional regulator